MNSINKLEKSVSVQISVSPTLMRRLQIGTVLSEEDLKFYRERDRTIQAQTIEMLIRSVGAILK